MGTVIRIVISVASAAVAVALLTMRIMGQSEHESSVKSALLAAGFAVFAVAIPAWLLLRRNKGRR